MPFAAGRLDGAYRRLKRGERGRAAVDHHRVIAVAQDEAGLQPPTVTEGVAGSGEHQLDVRGVHAATTEPVWNVVGALRLSGRSRGVPS
jgi:hypothetical protein